MKKKFKLSGKLRWLLIGLIILVVAGGGTFYYTSSTKASTPTETPLQTATANRGNIVIYANGTGTLAAAKTASFGFGASGQITELDIKIGEAVKAGQVIGKIDDTEVKAAYDQAKRTVDDLTTPAAIASAKQAVADADVSIYNAKAELEHLISSDVYYWEGQVAAA
jgi:multidrug efflux pump subunit AcrA (membrane-fusion protein)